MASASAQAIFAFTERSNSISGWPTHCPEPNVRHLPQACFQQLPDSRPSGELMGPSKVTYPRRLPVGAMTCNWQRNVQSAVVARSSTQIHIHTFIVTLRVLVNTFYAQPWQQLSERFAPSARSSAGG
jgi:hypothetical protein